MAKSNLANNLLKAKLGATYSGARNHATKVPKRRTNQAGAWLKPNGKVQDSKYSLLIFH